MYMRTIPCRLAISAGLLLIASVGGGQRLTTIGTKMATTNAASDAEISLMRKNLREQQKQIVALNLWDGPTPLPTPPPGSENVNN